MYQVHPCNVNGKLLRRFYEPLVLLHVLDPTRGAQRPDLITDRGLDEPSKLWRNFLDQLSWLCDTEPGGDTVTAIAAERTAEHPRFWLAANSASREMSARHLVWLLKQLSHLCTAAVDSQGSTEEMIVARCLELSSRRVKAYTKWLMEAIQNAMPAGPPGADAEDEVLWQGLNRFISLATDAAQLCALAYNTRRDDFMQVLYKRHLAHAGRSVWSDIRHYIGRLASWTKATHIACRAALRFPQWIENAVVRVVKPRKLVDRPDPDHLEDFDKMVRRTLSQDQESLAKELSQALAEIDVVSNVKAHFKEAYSGVRPRPHAELLILEHFHQHGSEFVADDRYIGCSKASCYCCHLYMQLHPGRFAPRACHGNVWINWAPPIPLTIVSPRHRKDSKPQIQHTFQMLQKMLPQLRQDLQQQILSKQPRRKKVPDSSTGMSSVAFVVRSLDAIREDFIGYPTLQDSVEMIDETTELAESPKISSHSKNDLYFLDRDGEISSSEILAHAVCTCSDKIDICPSCHHHHDRRLRLRSSAKEIPASTTTENENESNIEDTDEDEDVILFVGRRPGMKAVLGSTEG